MERRYISEVKPLSQYILQVDFVSGSRLLLDMKPYLDKFRFHSLVDLQTWNSVVTNGIFIRFGNVELSHDEILAMAEAGTDVKELEICQDIFTGLYLSDGE